MSDDWLRKILEGLQSGTLSLDEAVSQLSTLPYEDLLYAKIDHHRHLRLGFPEVVLGQGKTTEQIVGIVQSLAAKSNRVLVTRVGQDAWDVVQSKISEAVYNPLARAIIISRSNTRPRKMNAMGSQGPMDGAAWSPSNQTAIPRLTATNRYRRCVGVTMISMAMAANIPTAHQAGGTGSR